MYKSKNHSKYSLKAHIIFVVKYRKKLINRDIDFFLKTKIKQIEARSDFRIELMETDKDNRHSCVKLNTYYFSDEGAIKEVIILIYVKKNLQIYQNLMEVMLIKLIENV